MCRCVACITYIRIHIWTLRTRFPISDNGFVLEKRLPLRYSTQTQNKPYPIRWCSDGTLLLSSASYGSSRLLVAVLDTRYTYSLSLSLSLFIFIYTVIFQKKKKPNVFIKFNRFWCCNNEIINTIKTRWWGK